MRQLPRVPPRHPSEKPAYPELPDAELTQFVRVGAPSAREAATDELLRRHLPAVLSYAGICSRDDRAAEQLAANAFARALQEARRGAGPKVAWRHYLLLLVQRAAVPWTVGSRRTELEAGFAAWIDEVRSTLKDKSATLRLEQRSALLRGFRTLPVTTQGILWHAVVEEDTDAEVATLLGLEPSGIQGLKGKAQDTLRDAYLQAYLERGTSEECQGFGRIIEAVARPSGPRRSEDLERHLAGCTGCAQALGDLTALGERPDTVLAQGLLLWGGPAYVAARSTRPRRTEPPRPPERAVAAVPPPAFAGAGDRAVVRLGAMAQRSPAITGLAAATAAAVTVATVLLVMSGRSTDSDPAGSSAVATTPVTTVTATTTTTATVSASPSPSPTKPPKKPKRTPPPQPTANETQHAPKPPAPSRDDPFTQLVNADTGLCLDVDGGVLDKGTDVIIDECTGDSTQLWHLDDRGLVHVLADPSYCLDSRGDTDRGLGIWTCSSADGDTDNLYFSLAPDRTVRPYIAPDFAATVCDAAPGDSVQLAPATGDIDQQWSTDSAFAPGRSDGGWGYY